MKTHKKILIAVIAALAFVIGGCTKDDLSDCGGLRLQFRYTHNKQRQNLLAGQVRDIRVYVFNRNTGQLAYIIRPGAQDIARGYLEVDLPDRPNGVFTFVAWAGGSTDMMQGGYMDAKMTNPATHAYNPNATTGDATLENFSMMLRYNILPGNVPGDITPQVEQFDDLFFAMAQDITLKNTAAQTVDFDFIKNTSTLKVKVTGIDHLTRAPAPDQPLHLFVTGRNERYRFDNTIDGYARELRYEPPYRTLTATTMEVNVKVQRLDIDRHDADAVLLYVRRPETGFDMIEPLNVIKAILSIKNAQGAYIYRTQEDIDREDEFIIEISILHDLSVKVTVNGFEIVDVIPEFR
jgi:hypothetical protein